MSLNRAIKRTLKISLQAMMIFAMMVSLLPAVFHLQPTLAFTTTTRSGTTTAGTAMRVANTRSIAWIPLVPTHPQQRQHRTHLMAWRLIGKYFQIEEMEDRDSCTTEVILNPNSTVTTLETNGPIHQTATGLWKLDATTGDFIMTLHRTYEAGRDSKVVTDVGVFSFTTVRKFIGRLYNIGIKQGISGNIYDVTSDVVDMGTSGNSLADLDDTTPVTDLKKVGFFEMIDTTLSEDGEVTLRGRTRSM